MYTLINIFQPLPGPSPFYAIEQPIGYLPSTTGSFIPIIYKVGYRRQAPLASLLILIIFSHTHSYKTFNYFYC